MNTAKRQAVDACVLYLLFFALTAAVKTVDVQAIGPKGTEVGFASLNAAVHNATGMNTFWYRLTQAVGAAVLGVAGGFALFGLWQLARHRSLRRVDPGILLLGGIYALTLACYVFFEKVIVNYRPVLLAADPEASYPSSHTMLSVCILSTALIWCRARFRGRGFLTTVYVLCGVGMAVMVIGRLLSGVHWFTDICAGVLLGAALAFTYGAACAACDASRGRRLKKHSL